MHRHPQGHRGAGLGLLLAYLCALGWVTLRPLSVPWVSPPNLRPGAAIRAALEGPAASAVPTLAGGLLLFAPIGLLLPLAADWLHRRLAASLLRTGAVGAATALFVEAAQTAIPGRTVDVDSVLLGTVGVLVVHLLVYAPLRTRLRRLTADAGPRRAPTTQGPTLTSTGVGIAP